MKNLQTPSFLGTAGIESLSLQEKQSENNAKINSSKQYSTNPYDRFSRDYCDAMRTRVMTQIYFQDKLKHCVIPNYKN